ncbi:Uncharacterised protein [Amycolatopsis camponoti]|uniref:Uncharacterized protein n=1 Tax=Amycolatopsis camponoti TaxID=2606593 RepID=A0A6I8LP56_9PSEU|nr:Uncharacterised protein [Amycolatopsis camponoti]
MGAHGAVLRGRSWSGRRDSPRRAGPQRTRHGVRCVPRGRHREREDTRITSDRGRETTATRTAGSLRSTRSWTPGSVTADFRAANRISARKRRRPPRSSGVAFGV